MTAMERASLKKTSRPTCIVTFDCPMALSEVSRLSRQYKELEKIVNNLERHTKIVYNNVVYMCSQMIKMKFLN